MRAQRQPSVLFTTIGQLAESVRSYMADQRVSASSAVAALWDPALIEDDVIEELGRVGLIYVVNNLEHTSRGRGPVEAAPALHNPSIRDRMAALEEWVHLQGADGQYKPTLDFTTADWAAIVTTSRSMERSWKTRGMVAKEAISLLEAHDVDTASELPNDVREHLRTKLWTAFQRRET